MASVAEGRPDAWIVPDWPVGDRIGAVFTTREGGASALPFDGFNLGEHVGDDPAAVAANRQSLAGQIGRRPVFLRQVHGVQVARIDATCDDGQSADACLSTSADVACTIMVADCLPVLFADRRSRAVAAAHAGWRGLAAGVLEAAVGALRQASAKDAGNPPPATDDIVAWLGPCIGPDAFEVGEDVRQAFLPFHGDVRPYVRPTKEGKYLADLAGLARQRLHALGINGVYGNDGSVNWCTVTQSSRFFSHRRDARVLGSSGRMAACVWLR
ncbi:MAG: peptidoglycan editing factor PgeF [Burkholderiaceae bacterium]